MNSFSEECTYELFFSPQSTVEVGHPGFVDKRNSFHYK